ncbi:putative ribonuclease H-like domain-containing protein [Tanacetum coccineum]
MSPAAPKLFVKSLHYDTEDLLFKQEASLELAVLTQLIPLAHHMEEEYHLRFQHCLFACFLSQNEPKKISEALEGESWIDAMQEELLQFKIQKVCFVDPKHPNKVYKVVKALYGLHQAPRAWYATLSAFLEQSGYRRGTIDKTLFIKKDKKDIMLVQVYVDDIIFGSTKKSWCDEFEALMKNRFKMSSMGELTFFLGLQVKQKEDGIFISQDTYVAEILKKFDFMSVKHASTPIETHKPLVKDEEAADVDVHLYRSMIGSLIYLTASKPDIMFVVCACSRFQVTPKTSHLKAVKRIFRYLKGKPKLGLWYPRESSFDLVAYSDSNYGGANLDRKSTTGGCQFLGHRLISWQCKKQTIVATSTIEVEYVAVANCCGQKTEGNTEFHEIIDFLTRSSIHYALTVSPVVSTTFVEQFWMSAKSKTINNVRIDTLNNQAIFDNIQLMGHLDAKKKFVMYPRFISVFLAKQLKNVPVPLDHFPINALTSKRMRVKLQKDHLKPNQYPLLLTQVKTNLSHSLTHLPDLLLLYLFLIPIQRVLVRIMEITIQAKEIKDLKAQIKKLKKKARPGRKTAKSKPTAHKNQAFDDFDDLDAMDYMETEDAHNENGVSTEDQVSTVKPDEGTDKPDEGTDKPKVSTDKLDEGTAESKNGISDENATPTVFGDDETIADFLVSMSQNKAKQKGVEIKDAEDSDRPRPTSTRSVLTLKPLPKIDPKDKGKKVLEEEAESDVESEGVNEAERKFSQLANDEEIARMVQEEWEAEEEKKKLAEVEATKATLIRDYDDI